MALVYVWIKFAQFLDEWRAKVKRFLTSLCLGQHLQLHDETALEHDLLEVLGVTQLTFSNYVAFCAPEAVREHYGSDDEAAKWIKQK